MASCHTPCMAKGWSSHWRLDTVAVQGQPRKRTLMAVASERKGRKLIAVALERQWRKRTLMAVALERKWRKRTLMAAALARLAWASSFPWLFLGVKAWRSAPGASTCRARAGRWTLEDVEGGRRTEHAPQNVADPRCSAHFLHQLLEPILTPNFPEPPSVRRDALTPVIVPPLPPLRHVHPRVLLEVRLLEGVVIL